MSDLKKEQDNLAISFHNWRHDDVISKLFFKFLTLQSKIYYSRLKNLYLSNLSEQDKLIQLGALSAVINMIDSLMEINYQDITEWSESQNGKS